MKLIYATAVGFIVMFMLDYLWFGLIFKNYWAEHMHVTGMDRVSFHAIGDLCLALLMAVVYPMGFKGGSAMSEGAKFGVLMGLIAALPSSIHAHAGNVWSLHIVAIIVLNGIIVGGLTGIAIAMVYGGNKTATA